MREMKDSGIEWIGKIPVNWKAIPLKWIVKFGKGLPITKDNLIEQGVPVVNYGQIHSKSNNGTHLQAELIRFVSETYFESNPLSLGKEGDIFFADTSEDYAGIGNAVLIDTDTPVFAGYHTVIVRPDNQAYSRYLAYLFLTDVWRSQLCSRASGIKVFSITQGLLKKTTVILPPAEKVVKMTDYLDRKCSQIDAIIAKQQEVIEKLKEYKLSVITEAVTKGLNPDVPMKDSGIEWIGKIPEHWETASIAHVATVVRGASPRPAGDPRYFSGQGIPWITVAEVTKDDGKYIESTKSYLSEEGAKYSRLVEKGTLLLSNSGATLGVPKVTLITGCINDGSVAFFDLKIKQMYLLYVFKSRTLELRKQMQGYGQPNLNTTIIKSIVIPLPNIDEQKYICEYLDKRCKGVDNAIKIKEKVVNRLAEYKKSLIYEVVTGKKEV